MNEYVTIKFKDDKKICTVTCDSLSLKFVNNNVERLILEHKNKIVNISYYTSGLFKTRYHAVVMYWR